MTFLNEQTREYLFYHVNIKSTPPGIMQTIELCTPVRKSTAHTLTILNPLPAPVTVHTNTSVGDINLPANFIVGAQSEVRQALTSLRLYILHVYITHSVAARTLVFVVLQFN